MFEKGLEDYKSLAVPSTDPLLGHYRGLSDVPPAFLREVEHFFNTYKQLEGGKIETSGWSDATDARVVIDEAHRRWTEARKLLGR
jgi:inorganic pyrophosphatase